MKLNNYSKQINNNAIEIMQSIYQLIEEERVDEICLMLLETIIELNLLRNQSLNKEDDSELHALDRPNVLCAHELDVLIAHQEILFRLKSLSQRRLN